MKKILLSLFIAAAAVSCISNQSSAPVSHVLHEADVKPLSPESVVSMLRDGNARFVAKDYTARDSKAQLIESASDGQYPLAIVLSCIDSRVPVETIFDMGLGDLFVARVAGNIINGDILGSMEYACEHTGSKVVVVLGHTSCGAVHAACEGVDAGNMTAMLSNITPAIERAESEGGDHHSAEFQNRVVRHNVENMIAEVRKGSEILAHMEKEGEIRIEGAIFNLETGVIEFFDK